MTRTKDELLEHKVLNQIEADLESEEYESLSTLFQNLISNDSSKNQLESYLSQSALESLNEEETFCRY